MGRLGQGCPNLMRAPKFYDTGLDFRGEQICGSRNAVDEGFTIPQTAFADVEQQLPRVYHAQTAFAEDE